MPEPHPGSAVHGAGEVICLYPAAPRNAVPLSGVRSTLVTSGLAALRTRNLYERYFQALPQKHRETVASTIAGMWMPVEFMNAHYAACDSLGLTPEQVREIGRGIGARMNESALVALRRLATGVGVTPWTAINQYPRFWTRAFEGGGVRILAQGPKDAAINVHAIPFARSAYFRGTFAAIHEEGLGLFCSKMYVRVVSPSVHDDGFSLRCSWV